MAFLHLDEYRWTWLQKRSEMNSSKAKTSREYMTLHSGMNPAQTWMVLSNLLLHFMQEQQQELQSFLQLAESLDGQADSNNAFFQLVLERQIPQQLAGYMLNLFMQHPKTGSDTSEDLGTPQTSVQNPEGRVQSTSEDLAATSAADAEGSTEASTEAGADGQPQQTAICESSSQQWTVATQRPGLLYALQLLTALAKHQQVGLAH